MSFVSIKNHIDEGDLGHVINKKVRNKFISVQTKVRKKIQGEKRVALIGWIGAFNLGDEMMLDVTLGYFKKFGISATLISHKIDSEVEARYDGHLVIPRRPLTEDAIAAVLRDNDALFVNGGALIDDRDYDNSDSLARDISKLSRVFIENKKKVVVYGISTNSNITNEDAIKDYKYLIEHATYFSVRDKYSKEELSKIANEAKIHIVDDLVFADPIFAKKKEVNNHARRTVVVPIFDKDTTTGIEALLRKIIETTEDDIRIVSFYDEDYHEVRSIEAILNKLEYAKYRIKEIVIPRNSKELFEAFGDAKLIISMRYHGTLFAGAMGKRVLRLDHNKHPHYYYKNKYLASEYGYGEDYLNITDVPETAPGALRVIMDKVGVRNKIASRIVHKRASKNLHKVMKLL